MLITLIHMARKTNLTIDLSGVSERLDIAQMGDDGNPTATRPLRPGAKTVISVDPGVYKVMSSQVTVTADPADLQALHVMAVETKDPPPDQPKLVASKMGMARMTIGMAKAKLREVGVDPAKLHTFVVDARSLDLSLPR